MTDTQIYFDTITKTQDLAFSTASAWADLAQAQWDRAASQATKGEWPLPNPVDVVTATFDSIETIVGLQREYFTGLAKAFAPLVEQVVSDARVTAEVFAPKA